MSAQTSSSEEEDRNVIGKIPRCADPSCMGWLVDSFSGKYFIKCEDPKHNQSLSSSKEEEEMAEGYQPSKPTGADGTITAGLKYYDRQT